MSKTKLEQDPLSKSQEQPRKTRLGFLRKWDIVLVIVGLFLTIGTALGGQFTISAAVLVLGVIHLRARRKEEKNNSGTHDELYPIEEQSKRFSLEFTAVTVLIIMWLALILTLPIEGRDLFGVFGLMKLGIGAWGILAFVCSLFPTNRFTLLFPFSSFAVGMTLTVIYAFA